MYKLYSELAAWWPLLSRPEDYAEEAAIYWKVLCAELGAPPRKVLELGSGGGNTASHLKARCELRLVDLSPAMLAVSRGLNPECEHSQGDMRSVRLGEVFDAVLIQDAIMYLTREADLRAAFATARAHCRPGGAALFVPDWTRESFRPTTRHGGHDGQGRWLRYLSWTYDPDPDDTTVACAFAYMLREGAAAPRVEHEVHAMSLFPRAYLAGGHRSRGLRGASRPLRALELRARCRSRALHRPGPLSRGVAGRA